MKITVRYFARYRSIVGLSEEELDIPDGITVRELIEILKKRHPELEKEVFAEEEEFSEVNVSRNGRYVRFDEKLDGGGRRCHIPTSKRWLEDIQGNGYQELIGEVIIRG